MPNGQYITRQYTGVQQVSSGGGGGSYLLQEDFDTGSGATPPTGWAATDGGTWNFSNTSPALPQGGNNASAQAFAANSTWKAFTAQSSECWAFFQFRYTSAFSGQRIVCALQDSGGVNRCYVKVDNTGSVQIWDSQAEALGTSSTMSVNTNYYVWFHYKAGAGTGVIDVGFSSNGIRPTSGANFASVANTTENTTVSRIALIVNDDNIVQYWDHILVNNSQIGDNP